MEEIRFAPATHDHLDHAGLAQELKQAGVPLLVLEGQIALIPALKTHMPAAGPFRGHHDAR
jgi:ribonuclease/clavin/mitogillin